MYVLHVCIYVICRFIYKLADMCSYVYIYLLVGRHVCMSIYVCMHVYVYVACTV